MARRKLINIHSSVKGKIPTIDTTSEDTLQYGEIAVNYAKGSETLSIRNTNDEVVKFLGSGAFRYGCTNVTTLANVPVKTRLVYASISTDEALTIDTTSFSDVFNEFPDGVSMKIIAYNSSANNVVITFPWSDDNNICFVKSLTVNSGEYGVITVDFKSQTEIYFDGEVETQKSGYTGAEGIVALSNGTDYQFIKDKGTNLSDFKTAHSDYEPIGIVVIPASCSNILYPEGDVRRGKNIIMSLAPMNYATPDTGGSSNQDMYWGGYGTDTSLTNFSVVNKYDSTTEQSTISTNSYAYLPSDAFSSNASKAYPSLKYYSYTPYAPSPFKLVSGELVPNEEYYTTQYSTVNALSDFAGPSNTKVLIDLATAQTDWTTINTAITNSNNANYYTAACCCARFGAPDNSSAPKGTSSFLKHNTDNEGYDYSKGVTGVWYMPACGELGFIVPHRSRNDNTISNVKNLYGLTYVSSLGSGWFWSSSEYSASTARIVFTYNGDVDYNGKGYYRYVRAFCAV